MAQTILTFDGIRGEVTSVKPSDPTATADPFVLDIDYELPNYLDWSSKKAKAALPLLSIGLPNPPDDNTAPVKLGSPLKVDVSLKLELPPADTAQTPISVSVTRDYADFSSSYHFADHTLTAERILNFKIHELPASRTSDYLAFARAVNADENQALVVASATPGAPEIPAAAKPDDLFEAGLAALNSGNMRAAIPLFQRVVALDPKYKQAWNDLGIAYLRDGSYDDAVDRLPQAARCRPVRRARQRLPRPRARESAEVSRGHRRIPQAGREPIRSISSPTPLSAAYSSSSIFIPTPCPNSKKP